ncbi:DUF1349 domain-containing protein [Tropicimonas sp. IMCC6043]|uniref:DUF1349 domain-containing protein n=1 Tax=Tropicimonas sp. IMCC6043 TaxID=2510645 RepID=UPI00101D808E|nr:DUF1349 domain-containing protein [Tropicimonas sp. IMCC6043]RYH12090.1 DUF1349 domain-containing protein [Tropicimonas sp. IMCC6043]
MAETLPFDQGTWLNPPVASRIRGDRLEMVTAEGTDFWRRTHYGFERASGHALLFGMPGRFAAEITFSGQFAAKYEQAGLLLWEDETRWIKAGIEYADGRPNLAVVVTDGCSDWSMTPLGSTPDTCTIRMTATDTAVFVHARIAGSWQILRVTDFVAKDARLGPMACSPQSGGLTVSFGQLTVGSVPDDPLYLPK